MKGISFLTTGRSTGKDREYKGASETESVNDTKTRIKEERSMESLGRERSAGR